jgi:putative MATE family efflux protein
MLDTPIPSLVLKMAVPTVVALLVTAVYNMADTYFVSYLGTSATGAVGVNYSLEQIIMMAGSFLAIGANSYIARLLGAREDEKASRVLSTAFFTAFFTGSLVMVLGLSFLHPLVRILGATETVAPYAVAYAGYELYAAPFMAASFVMNQCLRSEGSAIYSMVGMSFGGVLNMALDPIFIFVFGWGVAGASAATAISKFVSFCILVFPYLRRKTLLHLTPRKIEYSRDIVSEIGKMGSASLLRIAFATTATVCINNLAGSYSDSALAAISVVSKVMLFLTFAILGFGQGFQPVAGYNWGACRYDRVWSSYRFASVVGVLFLSALSLFMGIFSDQVLLLFTKADMEMVAVGSFCLRTQCLVMPIQAWGVVVNMLYAGLGKARGAVVLSITRQGICFFPMLLVLPAFFGVWGVASVQAAADFLSLAFFVPFALAAGREIKARMLTMTAPAARPADLSAPDSAGGQEAH